MKETIGWILVFIAFGIVTYSMVRVPQSFREHMDKTRLQPSAYFILIMLLIAAALGLLGVYLTGRFEEFIRRIH